MINVSKISKNHQEKAGLKGKNAAKKIKGEKEKKRKEKKRKEKKRKEKKMKRK
ncbi:hypothetical protein [Methanosarcina sp. MTP4]|uniref:hypothetical protein n=1 Tax=Methanosarcina sp. MTP4 TaxID=1434100 RepID=UPI000A85A6D1|nr:hypothetical protein [Methanosarcina sp. MTP4]